jgi:hypothetical protein
MLLSALRMRVLIAATWPERWVKSRWVERPQALTSPGSTVAWGVIQYRGSRWLRFPTLMAGGVFVAATATLGGAAVWEAFFDHANDVSSERFRRVLGPQTLSAPEEVDLVLAASGIFIQFGMRLQLAAVFNIAIALAVMGLATALAQRLIESRARGWANEIRGACFAVVAGVAVGCLYSTWWAITELPGDIYGGGLDDVKPLTREQTIQFAVAESLLRQARATYELTILVAAVPLVAAVASSTNTLNKLRRVTELRPEGSAGGST